MMKLKTYISTLAMLCLTFQASAQGNTITVSTAAQFIDVLGPDRTIVIATDQPLNITEAIDQKVAEGTLALGETYYTPKEPLSTAAQVTYAPNTDGNTLQVRGCDRLTIRSAKGRATLLATPRYANVLEFIDCRDLKLENLVMGHTQDGYCDKGVLELDRCHHVTINDCDLYGCGTEGFVIDGCLDVTVNRTTVHDCTYYTMHVVRSDQVRFNDCIFRDNREYDQLCISSSNDVVFTGCLFDNLQGPLFALDDYVNFYCCTFKRCEMEPIDSEFGPQGYAVLAFCTQLPDDAPSTIKVKKPAIRPGLWTDGKQQYRVTRADAYRYVFTPTDQPDKPFALNCISAEANEYILAPQLPDEDFSRLVADAGRNGAADYVRLLDDGGTLLYSFKRIGK
ncbi:MAG: right-handed parallel beta-helix repeat-containing protein [Muribaculaceae bacterium]|nr:right-handed parallel beta-helix repeat-containing protein [Muribaculaceae bacterium]